MKIPAQKLIEVQNEILAKFPINLFTPVVDGQFIVGQPLDTVNKLKFGAYSEILIGSNAMEGVSILRSISEKMNYSLDNMKKNFIKPKIKKSLLDKIPKSLHDKIDLILNEVFPEDEMDVKNTTEMWSRFVRVIGDLFDACSDEHLITKLTESGRNAYYYQFKYKPKTHVMFKYTNSYDLADNFDETPFVFGHPLNKKNSFSQQEIAFSEKIMSFWSQFIKKGYF